MEEKSAAALGVCPECFGNGFLKEKDDQGQEKIIQCALCDSEGVLKWVTPIEEIEICLLCLPSRRLFS